VPFARVLCLLLSAAVTAAAAPAAPAQTSAKPLRLLVPVPAGGQADVAARLIAGPLRDSLGHPVVVDNRPGATGRIAVDAFRSAAPDGTTLLFAPIAVPVLVPLVFRDVNYDPQKDFAPVSQVSKFGFAFAVAANHPAHTLPEFVAWAKANPARASVGNPGAGSVPHFLGVMLRQATGIELVHVAYKGVGQLETELMSGQVAAGISAVSDLAALHRAGKLRILATAGAKRLPLLPTVPTFREQGYPSLQAEGWHGVYAPAGTPPPVIDRLSAAIVAAVRTPDLREKFAGLGLEPTGTTPEALASIMADDIKRWRPIVKAAGFTAE
jgi:tripartite-type tricarboxylate transporter receptor subunit TctC